MQMLKRLKYTYFLTCLTIDFWLIRAALFVCDSLPFHPIISIVHSILIENMKRVGDKAEEIQERFS